MRRDKEVTVANKIVRGMCGNEDEVERNGAGGMVAVGCPSSCEVLVLRRHLAGPWGGAACLPETLGLRHPSGGGDVPQICF